MFQRSKLDADLRKSYGFSPIDQETFETVVHLVENCVESLMSNVIEVSKQMKTKTVTMLQFNIVHGVITRLSEDTGEQHGGGVLPAGYFEAMQIGGGKNFLVGGAIIVKYVSPKDVAAILSHYPKYKIDADAQMVVRKCINTNLSNILSDVAKSGRVLTASKLRKSVKRIAPFLNLKKQ